MTRLQKTSTYILLISIFRTFITFTRIWEVEKFGIFALSLIETPLIDYLISFWLFLIKWNLSLFGRHLINEKIDKKSIISIPKLFYLIMKLKRMITWLKNDPYQRKSYVVDKIASVFGRQINLTDKSELYVSFFLGSRVRECDFLISITR